MTVKTVKKQPIKSYTMVLEDPKGKPKLIAAPKPQELKDYASTQGVVGHLFIPGQEWKSAFTRFPKPSDAALTGAAVNPANATVLIGDISGISAKKVRGGFEVKVDTVHVMPGDNVTYELYAQISGTWLFLTTLGVKVPVPKGKYRSSQEFTVSYADLNKALKDQGAASNLKIAAGAPLGIRVQFASGHDQGANGAGGSNGPFTAP